MTSGQSEKTQGQLRTLNFGIVSGAISAVGALLVAGDARTWWDALLMGVGLATTLLVVNRWTVSRFSRVVLPGLIVTAIVWVVGVLALNVSAPSYGFAIVATIAAFELPRHRRAVIAGIAAFAVVVLATKLVVAREDGVAALAEFVFISLCVAAAGIVFTMLIYAVHDLITELGESRRREAEHAVIRERMRFAGDLHDIQGHTLHVVKLKLALARKLVRVDTERAEDELQEIHTLVGETIAQTKELAYAQRRLNLSAELENAKNLFEAAGIRVRVDRESEVDSHAGELLGQVLRETTTNILRHAQARQVRITLSTMGITIVNDGAREGPLPDLRGLSTLRQRVADSAGELRVHQQDGWFCTAATLPAATPSDTRKDDQ
ncbi:histidine kinase [Nocardiopsis ansamitocini]|uniref:Signal transduction histidine kinase subgroup 3 dimerisation and phosphoacceptor domain-containing protein n=1 Tax=Nocardiopsis ansamitocini TaxID=1670832 RepID=A0A9W6P6L1_9ACTN|nr:histidine kinase [Nocardiopsis ansamitocini]GLU48400.1 hypothetical protein Nans01_27510 [Nocardiopsis ansamitocini]